MSDSRRAAERLVSRMQRIVDVQQRMIFFLVSLIFAFLATFFIARSEPLFSITQQYVFFILIFAVFLWITEAIPPFAVGLLIVGLLIFLLGNLNENQEGTDNYIDVNSFVHTWSNSVIWLMLGGFFLAESLKKTGLDKDLFKLSMAKAGESSKNVLLALMGTTAIASMVMSNTATTAMMIASIMPFIDSVGKDNKLSKAMLIGIPAAAAIGGMGTIIGSPPNAIAVDAINSLARKVDGVSEIGFLDWMIIGIPISIILTIIFWKILLNKFKIGNQKVNLSFIKQDELVSVEDRFQKRFVLAVLSMTIILWLTERWHGIPSAAVSGIPIILLPMVGIVSGDDVRKIPWDTLMLVAGGLSLGLAIQESGLAEYFVTKLKNFSFNGYLLMAVFAIATVVFSNIMSNTATATILIPIASILPGIEPVTMAVVIGLSASCAVFLPVSTPPNAIAFSTGLLKQSDFRTGGISIGIIGPILAIFWVLILSLF